MTTLSDKIEKEGDSTWGFKSGFLEVEDVREAVKKLKEELHNKIPPLRIGWGVAIDSVINEIFGEKLT